MDGAPYASHSANHEDRNGGLSPRPSPDTRRDENRHKPSAGIQNENRTPMSLPTALNSMLKTTTEIGDIGQFAIKPSRLPPSRKPIGTRSDHLLQESRQPLQLQNGQQEVDDRRRLPSYARDATSEIVSLYETASQKASSRPRVFANPDHRSYSMTQTSHSSNALSNHRSYTSLRSQPELGLLPRPRSPFLYPVRLKRLGFRSTSPIPTEGGRVDSSRNTEFERASYDHAAGPFLQDNVLGVPADSHGQATCTSPHSASPLTTYNHMPQFPLTAQSDLNDTHSPSLGRLPPGSQCYSPSLTPTIGSMQDLSFRPEVASTKASSASNNFRSTTTPVNYHRRSPNSFTGSASRSHKPSPLYYDYTEDFNFGETAAGESATGHTPSPTPFILNKSIHESTETASEASIHNEHNTQGSPASVEIRALATLSNADSLETWDDKPGLSSEDGQTERSTNVTQDIIPLYLDRRPYEGIVANPFNNEDFQISNQFASALNGSLLSSSDASNDFSPILLNAIDRTEHKLNTCQSAPEDTESLDPKNRTKRISALDRTSSFRLSTYLPIFPKPPDWAKHMIIDGDSNARCQGCPASLPVKNISVRKTRESAIQVVDEELGYEQNIPHDHHMMKTSSQFPSGLPTGGLQRSATTHDRRIRSSRYYSIDHGLSDLAQLISNFEVANGSFMSHDVYTPSKEITTPPSVQTSITLPTSRSSKDPLVLPIKTLLQLSPPPEFRTQITRFRSDGDLRASNSRRFEASSYALHEKFVNLDDYGEAECCDKSGSRPISNRPPSCCEPHLLAPKAVSPARVLRLESSVPQLMKALPPVPPNQIFETSSSLRSSPRHRLSISRSLGLEHKETSADIEPVPLEASSLQSMPSQQSFEEFTEFEQTLTATPKFRIKSRFFNSQRFDSPANSRPWNLDENYPWNGQEPTIRLSSLRSMIPGSQRGPKFKLRVTRASLSPSGTIRINPDAKSSLDLRSPKDLFTSSSNLSGIFRQVSRQFSSRKSSEVLEIAPGNHGRNPDLLGPPSSPSAAFPMSPTEVQSFFSEDSSQVRGHNSLRKRISNLRARIPSPYMSRPTANLNDNEVWGGQTPYAPSKGRSRLNVNSEQEDDYGMPIASPGHQKLRSKVSRWFKDAGLAMRRGVKLYSSSDVPCIPYR